MDRARPYFQFRLRTLMIAITIAGCVFASIAWFARALATVNERRQLIYYAARRPTPSGIVVRSLTPSVDEPSPLRRWLGDKGFSQIVLDHSPTNEEILRYRTAFPEANVVTFSNLDPMVRESLP